MTEAATFAEFLKDFENRLKKRRTPGEVGLLFGDLLTDWFEFVLLFNVKGTLAYGWKTFSSTGKVSRLDNLVVPLDAPSPFSRALRSGVPVGGVSTGLPEWRAILEMRGLKPPRPFVAIPVSVAGRVPVLAYVDSDSRPSPTRLSKLTQLSALAGWRIEEIILERKKKSQDKDLMDEEEETVLESESTAFDEPPPLPPMLDSVEMAPKTDTFTEKEETKQPEPLDIPKENAVKTEEAEKISPPGDELQALLREDWGHLYETYRDASAKKRATAPRLDVTQQKTATTSDGASSTAAPPSTDETWKPGLFDSKEVTAPDVPTPSTREDVTD